MAMVQRPNAVGLILCHLVIVEEKTRDATLANSFQRLEVDTFPSTPIPFFVYTVLTDGIGEFDLDFVVSRCDTLEDIYTRKFRINFNDPLKQLRLFWRVMSCSFPVPGTYQFGLQVDGDPITQSVLKIFQKGANHV
jgi:hypothetical protein